MSGTSLVASVEKRLDALIELSRRKASDKEAVRPTITISREFGCEGLPVAEKTQALLQEKTGSTWAVMDRGILDKVASNRDLSDEILTNLGEKNRILDDVMSTLFTNWSSDKETYRRLCNQILPYARSGNVIMVGIGAGVLTQNLPNCHKFRIVAPMEYKIQSVARRHQISQDEAEKLIVKRQKQRNDFIKDFLNKDITDPSLYDVIFNNAKNTADQIADMICHRVLSGGKTGGI
jgi:cytidylate kinase